ncbi:MAG TPA: hypothetical protein ENJ45_04675, partial [Phaeodactylibacter sp.]|nr:hypothetical protein [Phaeodactylibacter sp.]
AFPSSFYPDDNSDLAVDGPHVFYESGRVVVKSIVLKNGEFQVVENDYPSRDAVPPLKCSLSEDLSFTIHLKDKLNPQPAVVPEPSRLFAISDIEGNFHAFVKTLRGNGVIDKHLNWSFGDGHLVLVGDYFDRGLNVTSCLWLIYELENQAAKAGGMVHFVLGNHEEMNLSGDHRYVRNKYKKVAKKLGCSYGDLFSKKTELGRWLRTKNMFVKIGETIFVHGGLSPQFAGANISIPEVNKICQSHIGKKADVLQEKGGKVSMVFAKSGPLWYRGLFNKLSSDEVQQILSQYDARRVVVGHTIVDDISTLHDEMVYAIDVKHSEKIKNAQYNALFMEDGQFFKVNYRGKRAAVAPARKASEDGSGIVLNAIIEHKPNIIRRFLKEGHKVNDSYSAKKYLLLHFAIKNGNSEIVELLLDEGADPDLFQDGKSALMYAIKHKKEKVVEMLLNRSVNVNLRNHRQQTALYYAAKYGNERLVQMLLDAGAKIDVHDQSGLSPFQFAVKNRNVPVAKLLKARERK